MKKQGGVKKNRNNKSEFQNHFIADPIGPLYFEHFIEQYVCVCVCVCVCMCVCVCVYETRK